MKRWYAVVSHWSQRVVEVIATQSQAIRPDCLDVSIQEVPLSHASSPRENAFIVCVVNKTKTMSNLSIRLNEKNSSHPVALCIPPLHFLQISASFSSNSASSWFSLHWALSRFSSMLSIRKSSSPGPLPEMTTRTCTAKLLKWCLVAFVGHWHSVSLSSTSSLKSKEAKIWEVSKKKRPF